MKILFYDLETSGLDWRTNAILQFAGILAEMDEYTLDITPIEEFDYKMKPRAGASVSLKALEVNGFTLNEIKTFESDQTVFNLFQSFLDKHVQKYNNLDKITLAGYNNIHFDSDFIRKWFADNGSDFFGTYFWSNQLDVMVEATAYLISYRPAMKNFKLGNVANVIGVLDDVMKEHEEGKLHDALFDVRVTMAIWQKLVKSDKILKFTAEEAERIFDIEKKVILPPRKKKKVEEEEVSIVFEDSVQND